VRRIETLNEDTAHRAVASEAVDMDAVRVIAIHGSKGLEFAPFICRRGVAEAATVSGCRQLRALWERRMIRRDWADLIKAKARQRRAKAKAAVLPTELEDELTKVRALAPPPPSDDPIYDYLTFVYPAAMQGGVVR
jgi:ATP-dependent exoDNAse (exonuclease V) beta subunit